MSNSHQEPELLRGFNAWKALGEGGLPSTWDGYMTLLHMEKTMAYGVDDTIKPNFYNEPEKIAPGWSKATEVQKGDVLKSFLPEPLPRREGQRTRAKPFIIPQRERSSNEPQDPEIKKAYISMFDQLGQDNKDFTEWKTSSMEKHGQALFTKPFVQVSPLAAATLGEIGHIHSTDLSGHVTLSFADAEEVITKGWGERHRLSGTERIDLGYTMLYIPRSMEEAEIFRIIFQAGVDYMKSG